MFNTSNARAPIHTGTHNDIEDTQTQMHEPRVKLRSQSSTYAAREGALYYCTTAVTL